MVTPPNEAMDEPTTPGTDASNTKLKSFLSMLEAHQDGPQGPREGAEAGAGKQAVIYKQEAGLLTRTARRLLSRRQKKNRYDGHHSRDQDFFFD